MDSTLPAPTRFCEKPLTPPAFAGREMSLENIRIELHAQARLLRDAHEAVLDVWPIELQPLIHPAARACDRFARHIIADRCGPLAGGPRMKLAAGIVVCHGQPEDVR